MNQKQELPLVKISVRNLVEFILCSGDIDNRIGVSVRAEAMQEGSRMHRKIQKRMGVNYQAEVPLSIHISTDSYTLLLEGRADGILLEEETVIDEIKCVYRSLELLEEPVFVHQAQAMCYAYIYAAQKNLDCITVQMTYCNLDTEEMKRFRIPFSFEELKQWFFSVIAQYQKWADFQIHWKKKMTDSILGLTFPYDYRKGQKELAGDVYRTILRKKILFIQAPTGTGKTLSTVFPAVKAVGEGLADKIFYLTAKTITASVAKETFLLLYQCGYQAKTIVITAKEKICLCEEMDCNPIHCPYAKGHYDRVNDAVYDLLQKEDFFTREVLQRQAETFQVCPFELCLDTALWSDVVICDYNYAFDKRVRLKRFFAEGQKGDYIFLVDEAHNLVERAREMYSAQIYKEDVLTVKKLLKNKSKKLDQAFTSCNKFLLELKRECDVCRVYEGDLGSMIFSFMRLAERLDFFLQGNPAFPDKKEVMEFYLNLRTFLSTYETIDERYVIYSEHEADGRFKLRLFCVDPSKQLQECLDKGRAAVFFSATLLPIQYYKEMLSTKTDNYAVYAQTSFSKEQSFLCIGKDVSSRYKRRNELEFQKIAAYIAELVSAKKGNYMVFFPSYQLMEQVFHQFRLAAPNKLRTIVQKSGMKEDEREAFLKEFSVSDENSLVAFCVLGGIFGEGIDLKEEQLIGVMIVGTGLPQIGNEREILKEYYDRKTGEGFDYAYRFPGMNKVLQAAGRVIRTALDRGVIALLDERFLENSYRRLFPREWASYTVLEQKDVKKAASDFWEQF